MSSKPRSVRERLFSNRESGEWHLREWRLSNFKSIHHAALRVAPLTVLVGQNSSGKSSVLQSILLAVQAIRESSGYEEDGTFSLNGDLVSLGRFEDVRTWNPEASSRSSVVRFGATLDGDSGFRPTSGPPRSLRHHVMWDVEVEGAKADPSVATVSTFDASGFLGTDPAKFGRPTADLPASAHAERLHIYRSPGEESPRLIEVSSRGAGLPVSLTYQGALEVRAEEEGSQRVDAARFRAFLPEALLKRGPLPEMLAAEWLARSSGWQFPLRVDSASGFGDDDELVTSWIVATALDQMVGGFHRAALSEPERRARLSLLRKHGGIRQALARGGTRLEERIIGAFREEMENTTDLTQEGLIKVESDRYWGIMQDMRVVMDWLASRVHYLGPLRQDPQPTYPFGPPDTLGKKGEHAALILYRNGDREVLCPHTPDDQLTTGSFHRRRPLREAVEMWGRYLGLFDQVRVMSSGRTGVKLEVSVAPGSEFVDPTSVGVGVSQMLPVLIICLSAQGGDLLLLEQPELHLHPRVQQRLADFLLGVTEDGRRQVIVETHSEYLVTRLRLRIAQSRDPELRTQIGVYFSKWTPSNGTTFTEIQPTELGTLEQWPAGFFDESTNDARELLKAAADKVERERNKAGSA